MKGKCPTVPLIFLEGLPLVFLKPSTNLKNEEIIRQLAPTFDASVLGNSISRYLYKQLRYIILDLPDTH